MTKPTIAIIGGGNMGTSLIGGLIANHYPPSHLWVADPNSEKRAELQTTFKINTTEDATIAIQWADVVILAVKPQTLAGVCASLRSVIGQKKPLIISIAAGVREESINQWLGGNLAIVRSMPNTPALIGCGATALYANAKTSLGQKDIAESILRAVGIIIWVSDETLMDTVTALSGSGPAYFFLIMETLQEAAENLGLPKDAARLLTLQTAFGAAKMALESNEDLAELRQRVTSKGGTTEKALNVFEEAHLRDIFNNALLAAKKRSEELAELLDHATE